MGKGILRRDLGWVVGVAVGVVACGARLDPTAPLENASGNVPSLSRSSPGLASAPGSTKIRAAYFYHYMDLSHMDSLAAAGFNRAVIKFVGDSLRSSDLTRLREWTTSGGVLGIDVVPTWTLQSRARIRSLSTTRRYTPGGAADPDVGCPLDESFWRSALFDRAREMLRAAPECHRLGVDLEIYSGGPHHYDAGPCRCAACLREYRTSVGLGAMGSGIEAFQEERLTRILTAGLQGFAREHPGVEIGILDLDLDSFVHRAMGRALVRSRVPTVDYSERSYSNPTRASDARSAIRRLGVDAGVVGGLWLKRFTPSALESAVRSLRAGEAGYFVFTTYSLWQSADQLEGPYTLDGPRSEYWAALGRANR